MSQDEQTGGSGERYPYTTEAEMAVLQDVGGVMGDTRMEQRAERLMKRKGWTLVEYVDHLTKRIALVSKVQAIRRSRLREKFEEKERLETRYKDYTGHSFDALEAYLLESRKGRS
jgi:hypothetical protein